VVLYSKPVERVEKGDKLSRAPRRLRAPPSLRNIKYTRMQHLKNFFKNSPQRGPRECFPGPRCGFRGAATLMSKSPVAFTTSRSWESVCSRTDGSSRLSDEDPVVHVTPGIGVPTTLHGNDVDCVSAIFTVGGGERMKLGSSAIDKLRNQSVNQSIRDFYSGQSSLVYCLHDQANIEQTSSKHRAGSSS